jgi:hypothetical protein
MNGRTGPDPVDLLYGKQREKKETLEHNERDI